MQLHNALHDLHHQDENLTVRQIHLLLLLATLARTERTVRGVAKLMGVPKPVISRAADRLELHGWARRVRDPLDHRSVFLDITPAERKAIALLLALEPASVARAA